MILNPQGSSLCSFSTFSYHISPCSHCQWRFLDAAESSSFFSCDLWGLTLLFRVFRTTLRSTEPFERTFNDPVRVWPHEGPTHFYRILKVCFCLNSSFQNKQHFSQCLFHLCHLNNSYTNKRHHFIEDLFTKIYLHYFTFRRKTKRSRGHISYLHGRSSPQIRFSSNRTAAGPE